MSISRLLRKVKKNVYGVLFPKRDFEPVDPIAVKGHSSVALRGCNASLL